MIPAAIYSSFQLMPLVMVIAALAYEEVSNEYTIRKSIKKKEKDE